MAPWKRVALVVLTIAWLLQDVFSYEREKDAKDSTVNGRRYENNNDYFDMFFEIAEQYRNGSSEKPRSSTHRRGSHQSAWSKEVKDIDDDIEEGNESKHPQNDKKKQKQKESWSLIQLFKDALAYVYGYDKNQQENKPEGKEQTSTTTTPKMTSSKYYGEKACSTPSDDDGEENDDADQDKAFAEPNPDVAFDREETEHAFHYRENDMDQKSKHSKKKMAPERGKKQETESKKSSTKENAKNSERKPAKSKMPMRDVSTKKTSDDHKDDDEFEEGVQEDRRASNNVPTSHRGNETDENNPKIRDEGSSRDHQSPYETASSPSAGNSKPKSMNDRISITNLEETTSNKKPADLAHVKEEPHKTEYSTPKEKPDKRLSIDDNEGNVLTKEPKDSDYFKEERSENQWPSSTTLNYYEKEQYSLGSNYVGKPSDESEGKINNVENTEYAKTERNEKYNSEKGPVRNGALSTENESTESPQNERMELVFPVKEVDAVDGKDDVNSKMYEKYYSNAKLSVHKLSSVNSSKYDRNSEKGEKDEQMEANKNNGGEYATNYDEKQTQDIPGIFQKSSPLQISNGFRDGQYDVEGDNATDEYEYDDENEDDEDIDETEDDEDNDENEDGEDNDENNDDEENDDVMDDNARLDDDNDDNEEGHDNVDKELAALFPLRKGNNVMSEPVAYMNEYNTNERHYNESDDITDRYEHRETFDTILEYLYKYSNNPIFERIKQSNGTKKT